MSSQLVNPYPRRGATLLELVIALALLGVVAGIGLLSFSAWDRPKSNGLGLRHCRMQAVRAGRPQPVVMDTLELLCLPDGAVAGAGPDQLVGRVR